MTHFNGAVMTKRIDERRNVLKFAKKNENRYKESKNSITKRKTRLNKKNRDQRTYELKGKIQPTPRGVRAT